MAAGPRAGEALAQKLNGAGFFRQRWIERDGRIGAGAPFGLIGPYIGVQSQKVLLLSQIQMGEITAPEHRAGDRGPLAAATLAILA